MIDRPIRQVAYFTPDARAAAKAHRRLFGSGPYLVSEHIPLKVSRHRGIDRPLDHTSAYGQWGPLMVEFVQQNNPDPSAFHDMYPHGSGRSGLHHVALFVEDVAEEMARLEAQGMAPALYAELDGGFAFAMMDANATLGHMIELYAPTKALTDLYTRIAEAADGGRGTEAFLER